jgi:hypothetical protein
MDIYDVFAFTLVISGVFGGGYIARRAFMFWDRDRFLSVLDFVWSAALFFIAGYYFAVLTGMVYSAPITTGAYIRPTLVILINIPVIITIARR